MRWASMSNQQIALLIAALAYVLVLAFWLWAGISYLKCIGGLPETKERCNAYSSIVMSKIFLAAVVSGPASAIFKLLKP